jgi:hypothetical protein
VPDGALAAVKVSTSTRIGDAVKDDDDLKDEDNLKDDDVAKVSELATPCDDLKAGDSEAAGDCEGVRGCEGVSDLVIVADGASDAVTFHDAEIANESDLFNEEDGKKRGLALAGAVGRALALAPNEDVRVKLKLVANTSDVVADWRGDIERVGSGKKVYPNLWQIWSDKSSIRSGEGSTCGLPPKFNSTFPRKRAENAGFPNST